MGSLGSQCIWSSEMVFGSPYLLHLGLSKSAMAFVFVAGPLSGLIVQPVIGILSDRSTHPWGRRRPMLLAGLALSTVAMLQIGYAKSIASLVFNDVGTREVATRVLAISAIFAIDFSINAVMALDRSLLLDLVPSQHQPLANVWAARLAGAGSILGFFIGQINLSTYPPFSWFPGTSTVGLDESAKAILDETEVQVKCVVLLVVFMLVWTHIVTIFAAKETPLAPSTSSSSSKRSKGIAIIISPLRQTWTEAVETAKMLPRPAWEIFRVQFFAWIAWFPVLFYSTTWIAKIAANSPAHHDSASSVRLGSLGMLMHAIVSIFFTIVSPSLLQLFKRLDLAILRRADHLTAVWAFSNLAFGFVLLSTYLAASTRSIAGAMVVIALTGFPWAFVQFVPNALLGILIQKHDTEESEDGAQGHSDAISMSTVTHTIGHDDEEDPRDGDTSGGRPRPHSRSSSIHAHASQGGEIDGETDEGRKRSSSAHGKHEQEEEDDDEGSAQEVLSFGPRTARDVEDGNSSSSNEDDGEAGNEDEEESLMREGRESNGRRRGRRQKRGKKRSMAQRSGTVLGLHNISLVLPQFLTTVMSTIVFALVDSHQKPVENGTPQKDEDELTRNDGDAIGLVLRIGGVAALVAGIFGLRLAVRHRAALSA
ncbi:MFS general substrate transporter [Acaromyces ingoldii]|uniref:MFS general substrate transporter n=1 Tax=Acaromyces ingoldii TaxID=215250 RepID=A0A316YY42_9BASI|nr:MFS general substrate transporter [Acaromyces ingoldii]PWN94430.1 MFS general substrate transporter [Acaromyces ingoldii]